MLKVWGRTNSVNVKKALWALEELGIAYERIDAGLKFGVVNSPEYRAMNPNGLVPTIEDDGLVLWESHSIVRYLCAKHGAGTVWPTEPRGRALADRWMDWAVTFGGASRNAFWGLIRTAPEQRDPKAIEESLKKSAELAAVVDAHLANAPYLGGENFTMGDIPLGCHMQVWLGLPVDHPTLPNLRAWFERLRSRPAFAKVVDLPLS